MTHSTPIPGSSQESAPQADLLLRAVFMLDQRITAIEQIVREIKTLVASQRVEKEWYTTTELAEAMGRSQYTIQERWANEGRIECEKDPESGKWRIPGREYRRLVSGGALRTKRKPSL